MKAIKSVEFNFSIKAGDVLNRNIRKKLKMAADKFNLSMFVLTNHNGEIIEILVFKGWISDFKQNIIKACIGCGNVEAFTSIAWLEDVKDIIYQLYKFDDEVFAYVNNRIIKEDEAILFRDLSGEAI